MRIAALFLCAALAFAAEPDIKKQTKPITINLDNVDPKTAAKMLKDEAKLKVEFAPQADARRANVRLVGVPTATAMETIAEHFGCEAQFLGKRRWRVAPAWQIKILKIIESNKVTGLNVEEMPIGQLLALVRSEIKVDIVLDRSVPPNLNVTMRISKVNYRQLLDLLCEPNELKWELRYGVVYVATADRFQKMPVLPPRLKSPALRKLVMPLQLERVALPKFGETLTLLTGTRFVVPKGAAARTVTVRARQVTLEQALAIALYPWGMTAVEKDGAVHIQAGMKR